MITIAIDPGLSGACSVFDHNGLKVVFDLPTMKIPGVGPGAKVQRKFDAAEFVRTLRHHWPAEEKAQGVLELIQTNGAAGHGIQTQASLIRTVGAIEAVLECLRVPTTQVRPQAWKKFFGLIDPNWKDAERKNKSLEKARVLYPACDALKLAKHHNRAEAVLLGHYLIRNVN